MQKINIKIITAHNGLTVIDATSEAETRYNSMLYIERRYHKEQQRKRNPLNKLAAMCGLL